MALQTETQITSKIHINVFAQKFSFKKKKNIHIVYGRCHVKASTFYHDKKELSKMKKIHCLYLMGDPRVPIFSPISIALD